MDSDTTPPASTAHSIDSQALLLVLHENADPVPAFAHALRLALSTRAKLEIIDLRPRRRSTVYLGVRDTLQRWKVLPDDATGDDLGSTGLKVKKVVKEGKVGKEVGKRLEREHRDLLVLSTHPRRGVAGLLSRDVSQHIPHVHRQTTLYTPEEGKGFVDTHTGQLGLKRILVPIAESPAAEPALRYLLRLLDLLGILDAEVLGLHMGELFPHISPSAQDGINWQERVVPHGKDSIPALITRMAREWDADLVVMATNGRDTFSQRLMGSTTEQVVRNTPCPVLAVAVEP